MAKELKPRTQLRSSEISKVLSGMFTTAKTIINKTSTKIIGEQALFLKYDILNLEFLYKACNLRQTS